MRQGTFSLLEVSRTKRLLKCLQLMVLMTNVRMGLAGELFPFGLQEGHTNLGEGDDGSLNLPLDASVKVLGQSYEQVSIKYNGFLLIEGSSLHASTFLDGEIHIVGFGVDVLVAVLGAIWYAETRDAQKLAQLTSEIHLADETFEASWAGIYTWDAVTGYGVPASRRNSFQIVLVFDEARQETHAILNYAALDWTETTYVTTYSAGINTGITNTSIQLGADLGPDDIRTFLLTKSNVGVPGKFIFRMNEETLCIANLYPRFTIDDGPIISNISSNFTFRPEDQSIEVKCQADPNDWDDTLQDFTLTCGDLPASSTPALNLDLSKDWDGKSCRCQRASRLACDSTLTFNVIPTEPTSMAVLSIQDQTTEVVILEQDASTVTFECVTNSFPAPNVIVKGVHTGRVIANQTAPDNKTVRVDVEVSCDMMDQYMCVAENELGSSQSPAIAIRIHCLEILEEVSTVRVLDDSIAKVAISVRSYPDPIPEQFSLSRRYQDGTHYTQMPKMDSTNYLVRYTQLDDVLHVGTVELRLLDYDLARESGYAVTLGNGVSQVVALNLTSVRGRYSLHKENNGEELNLIIVGIVGCIMICILVVLPIAYWCYAIDQGIKPVSFFHKKKPAKARRVNRMPMVRYAVRPQHTTPAQNWPGVVYY